MTTDYTVIHTSWHEHGESIRNIRAQVFVEEQKVPLDLEWEDHEDEFHYVLALSLDNQAIGTGRMDDHGHIGRMAVLKNWRDKGVGRSLLKSLIEYAQQKKITRIFLNAQTSAIPFYEKQGFTIISEEYMEAGIPHQTMEKMV